MSKKYNIHIISTPTLPVQYYHREYGINPFNQKTYLLSRALTKNGIKTFFYGYDDSAMKCTKHFILGNNKDPLFKKRTETITSLQIDALNLWTSNFIEYYEKNKADGTIDGGSIFLFNRNCRIMPKLWDVLNKDNAIICEYPVAYLTSASTYKIFESHSIQHLYMGYQHRADTEHLSLHDGKKFDTTNNSFFTYKQIRPIMDTDTFTFTKKSEDYYLYVGRILEAKGIGILLSLVTQFPDKKFVFMFSSYHTPHALDDAKNVTIYTAPEFEKKVEIIRNARALISPTLASECFGSAHIEGQLCGVPSITTDWGAFTETIKNGVNGFRCRSWSDFCSAMSSIKDLDREKISKDAHDKYGEAQLGEFNHFFEYMATCKLNNWYNS